MSKTYKTTVTLRKKSLSKERKALILDYYIGNIDPSSSMPVGKRVRQHLGLYLIPEKTQEDVETNLRTMEKANQILVAKRKEINSQSRNDSTCYNLIKDEHDEQDRLMMSSVRLKKRSLRNGNISLYLDVNVGENDLELEDRIIRGRKKVYLFLYLKPENSRESILENEKTLMSAKKHLVEVISAVKGLIRDKKLRAACRSNLQDFNIIEENKELRERKGAQCFDNESFYDAINKLDDLLID